MHLLSKCRQKSTTTDGNTTRPNRFVRALKTLKKKPADPPPATTQTTFPSPAVTASYVKATDTSDGDSTQSPRAAQDTVGRGAHNLPLLKAVVSHIEDELRNNEAVNATKLKEDQVKSKYTHRWASSLRSVVRPKSGNATTTNPSPVPYHQPEQKNNPLHALQAKIVELEARVDSEVATKKIAIKEKAVAEQRNVQLKGELEDVKEKLVKAEKELEEDDLVIGELEVQKEELKEERAEMARQLKEQQDQIADGKALLQEKEVIIEELQVTITTQTVDFVTLTRTANGLKTELAELGHALEDVKKRGVHELYETEVKYEKILAEKDEENRKVVRGLEEQMQGLTQRHKLEIEEERGHQEELVKAYEREMKEKDEQHAGESRAKDTQILVLMAKLQAMDKQPRADPDTIKELKDVIAEKDQEILNLRSTAREEEWKIGCGGLIETLEERERTIEEKDQVIFQLKGRVDRLVARSTQESFNRKEADERMFDQLEQKDEEIVELRRMLRKADMGQERQDKMEENRSEKKRGSGVPSTDTDVQFDLNIEDEVSSATIAVLEEDKECLEWELREMAKIVAFHCGLTKYFGRGTDLQDIAFRALGKFEPERVAELAAGQFVPRPEPIEDDDEEVYDDEEGEAFEVTLADELGLSGESHLLWGRGCVL